MTDIHIALAVGVVALNALAGGWGAIAWLRHEPSVIFWYLLRVAQVVTILQVVLGLFLLVRGSGAPDALHVLYGCLPIVVAMVSEGLRVNAAAHELEGVEDVDALERSEQPEIARRVVLREMAIMSVGAILIVTLALRAAASAGALS